VSEAETEIEDLPFGAGLPPIILDRSTLERWGVVCPHQGWHCDRGGVSSGSTDTVVGDEVHKILAEACRMRQEESTQLRDLVDYMDTAAQVSRPDVQPLVISSLKRAAWPVARLLCQHGNGSDRHPDDLIAYDGGREDRSGQLAADLIPADDERGAVRLTSELDLLLATASEEELDWCDWKGLPLDTPLPTPTGWTTMGEVEAGDCLFDSEGKRCYVVGKSQPKENPCLRFTFDDTTSLVCDREHLWKLVDGRVVKAADVKRGALIPTCGPVETKPIDLPIDPYVLGLWLGDGKRSSGEITKPDDFVWEEMERRGYRSGDYRGRVTCRTSVVIGLQRKIRDAGLYKNKHIPPAYLRASFEQRMDLLRGLMDSDGNANPTRQQAIFTSCDRRLSDSVMELLHSLGQRPLQSVVTARGFGKVVTAYPISFRPRGINPFLMPRKADRIDPAWGTGKSWRRKVMRIEPAGTQTTQCIGVDSPDNTYLCTKHFIPTHNSGWKWWTATDVRDAMQFQMHAWLIFHRFPTVSRINCRVFMTREAHATSPVAFHRDRDFWAIHKRLMTATGVYLKYRETEKPEDVPAWPTPEKCAICPAAARCHLAHRPSADVAIDPTAALLQYAATQAAADSMKANLTTYVRNRKADLEAGAVAFGTGRPKAQRAPAMDLYDLPTAKT
jgi:hypothetical protein